MAIVNECVGLDIGQTGLKAVRFRRRLSGRETIDYFQHPLPFSRPEDLEPARRVQSLRGFLWRHGLYATDRLVTAIPCQDLFVRTLSFPFNDAAKLAQVVPFEVENLVPMPLEDLAVDSLVLPPGLPLEGLHRETKGSEVLVTAAPRDKVAEHLRFLAQADIEPSAINVDAMALFSVTQYLQQEEGAAVPQDLAIIDIGASKTTLCLIEGGRPVMLRTILWGGNYLTQALAVRHASSFADAERHKRTLAVDQVNGLLEPIVKELRITLQAYQGGERSRLTHAWICGGGSKMQELGGHLSRQVGLYPVGPRQGFGADTPRAFSIAFGLAIHPKIVRPRWRFKSSPLGLALDLKGVTDAASPDAATVKQNRRLATIAGLVIAVLALVDVSVHYVLQGQRVTQLKTALHSQYEQVFGAGTGAAPGEEVDQAKYQISVIDKALGLVDATDGKVLFTLSTFVKQLPPGTMIKIRELTVDGAVILMEGETSSFDAVERIKQTLAASPRLTEVSVTETRVGAAPNQVVFRMTITVKKS
ncbi:MAG: pilus assembly protein PilM [Nitrospira sp.]|nr:pilus assembly protein PilM [Nitrospira sp.]